MTSRPIVSIIDDDPGICKSLRMVMQSAGFQTEVFRSAEEYLEKSPVDRHGCILLDLRLPGMSGIELLELLRSRHVRTPVIMITGHGDIPAAVYSMKLGAADFLGKPVSHHALLEKVRAALAEDQRRRLEHSEADAIRARLATLTKRELQLLKLLAAGKSSKRIAAEIGLSVKTVENHRAHLLAKTGAENAADLVRMSVIAGLA